MKLSKLLPVVVVGGVVVMSLTRCGKKEEATTAVAPTFSSLYTNVFTDCGKCHAAGKEHNESGYTDLDFSTQALAFESLAKTPSANTGCDSFKYIASGNPDGSVVYVLLTSALTIAFKEKNGTGCKIAEPGEHGLGGDASAETVSAMKTWISNGAKND